MHTPVKGTLRITLEKQANGLWGAYYQGRSSHPNGERGFDTRGEAIAALRAKIQESCRVANVVEVEYVDMDLAVPGLATNQVMHGTAGDAGVTTLEEVAAP